MGREMGDTLCERASNRERILFDRPDGALLMEASRTHRESRHQHRAEQGSTQCFAESGKPLLWIDDPELGRGEKEGCGRGCNAEITEQCEFDAASVGRALDGGDERAGWW